MISKIKERFQKNNWENAVGAEVSLKEKAASVAIGLFILFIIILTATEALCFWIPNWWYREYAKYETHLNVPGGMELEDAVHVTEDMLDYCAGRLDTLDNTEATIGGVTAAFFTEREKQHLADCRELFMKGLRARVICIIMVIGLFLYLYVHRGKQLALKICARGYLYAVDIALVFAFIILMGIAIDFTKAFTIFHKIFFDNDLWILYPDKDNLINIMQEVVFYDAALWIFRIALAMGLILFFISRHILKKEYLSTDPQ